MSCEHGGSASRTDQQPEYVGQAWMDAQGVLTVEVVLEGKGAIGHARMVIPPDDPRYEPYLRHIGPMRPGDYRPVRPWPRREPPTK